MRYCIDALNYNGKYFSCIGWAAPERQGDRVELTVYDHEGNVIPLEITRFLRSDVLMAMYKRDGNERYGFTFTYKAEHYEDAVMEIRSLDLEIDHIKVYLRFREQEELYYRQHTAFGTMKRFLRSDQKKDFFKNERFASLLGDDHDYAVWYEKQKPTRETLKNQRNTAFSVSPLVSVLVPVYNPKKAHFEAMIQSVRKQSYRNFELVLANGSPENAEIREVIEKTAAKDKRIRAVDLAENGGISENTNAALKAANGEWIALLDQDDLLTPDALYQMMAALNDHPDSEVFYSDEDKLEDETGFHKEPYFKPDFSPALLDSNNYICHFLMVKKALAENIGGFRKAFDGAQDFDFVLRLTEATEKPVIHVPHILYHWRIHESSTAGNIREKSGASDAGMRVLQDLYQRRELQAEITALELPGRYHAYVTLKEKPLVSVLIPNKDHTDDLKRCIGSLLNKATYGNIEIIVIENNSEEKETFDCYEELKQADSRIRVVTWEREFNYSAINNFGAQYANGEYLLLLNNDTEAITPDFLESMVAQAMQHHTGIVGAKLLYEDNTIQHAGVLTLTEGAAHHVYLYASKDEIGYMGRLIVPCNVSAVTGACMLVKREVFEKLGGLDEEFAVAYNDVDFCLRALDAGYEVVYDAFAMLYHYESKSRGYDGSSKEKKKRLEKEAALLYARHGKRDGHDPYYNPNLSMQRGCYKLP